MTNAQPVRNIKSKFKVKGIKFMITWDTYKYDIYDRDPNYTQLGFINESKRNVRIDVFRCRFEKFILDIRHPNYHNIVKMIVPKGHLYEYAHIDEFLPNECYPGISVPEEYFVLIVISYKKKGKEVRIPVGVLFESTKNDFKLIKKVFFYEQEKLDKKEKLNDKVEE
jgi:hypothetical protein